MVYPLCQLSDTSQYRTKNSTVSQTTDVSKLLPVSIRVPEPSPLCNKLFRFTTASRYKLTVFSVWARWKTSNRCFVPMVASLITNDVLSSEWVEMYMQLHNVSSMCVLQTIRRHTAMHQPNVPLTQYNKQLLTQLCLLFFSVKTGDTRRSRADTSRCPVYIGGTTNMKM